MIAGVRTRDGEIVHEGAKQAAGAPTTYEAGPTWDPTSLTILVLAASSASR